MQFKKKLSPALVFSAVVSGGLVAGTMNAYADDSEELAKLRAQIEELDQKIKVLDRKNEIAAEESAAKKKETPIVSASKDGFGFKSADGNFDIRFKALMQLDYRSYFDHGTNTISPNNINGFDFRRIRPTIEGTLWGKYDFRFTPEFGEDKTTVDSGIVDAYVDARFTPYFQVKAGKFKPFLGLERLQSGSDIKFIERSYVSNNIEPNRDLGASIHGDILDNKVNYAVGVFNGVVDGGDNKTLQDTNSDKDYAARIFVTPFKDTDSPLAGLGLGISASHGNFIGSAGATGLASYKTPGQQSNFFTYAAGTFGSGDHDRISPQGYFYYGPFGVLAEYARVSQDVTSATKVKANLDNDAWQIAGSWLITGEDASFKGVKPKVVFDLDNGGWGAWELVARYEQNNIDTGAFATSAANPRFASPLTNAKSASSWAAGVNWYLNQNVRVEANYEQTKFDLGGGGTLANPLDRPDEKIFFTRLQLSY